MHDSDDDSGVLGNFLKMESICWFVHESTDSPTMMAVKAKTYIPFFLPWITMSGGSFQVKFR
jgi:hypothetical protein